MILPIASFANATNVTSKAGIYFTEKEEIKNIDGNKNYSDNQKNNEKKIEFPQTGEHQNPNIIMIGFVILMALLVIKKIEHMEEEK